MKRATINSLLRLSLSSNTLTTSSKSNSQGSTFLALNSFSTKRINKDEVPNPKLDRDSMLLEKFKQRKLNGSSTAPQTKTPKSSLKSSERKSEGVLESDVSKEDMQVVSRFGQLGLNEEVIEAVGEMGVFVPSEIQCVGIPAVLDGKTLVLSSSSGSGRTLAYLLPLIQLLRKDEASSSLKSWQPRAIVLCNTEEQAEKVFRMAMSISYHTQLKSVKGASDQITPEEYFENAQVGMVVGTPNEILKYLEEKDIVATDVKYMVLDKADAIFKLGLAPEVKKILDCKENCESEDQQGLQTIMVTSTMAEILGKQYSSHVQRLEGESSGEVAAMLLEIDPLDASHIIRCPDALTRKVAEALDSLHSPAS